MSDLSSVSYLSLFYIVCFIFSFIHILLFFKAFYIQCVEFENINFISISLPILVHQVLQHVERDDEMMYRCYVQLEFKNALCDDFYAVADIHNSTQCNTIGGNMQKVSYNLNFCLWFQILPSLCCVGKILIVNEHSSKTPPSVVYAVVHGKPLIW